MSLQSIVDAATNPQVAVPLSGAGALAQLLAVLPHAVSAGWLIYVLLLISHKAWKMYKEWRDDPSAPWKGSGDE